MTGNPAVSVRDLVVSVPTRTGARDLVDGISFDVLPGRVLGIVGESGSGKSLTALSLMRLHRAPVAIRSGSITVAGDDVLAMSRARLNRYRGTSAAMIYQNPMSSLNPVMTVGAQVAEAVRLHSKLGRAAARTAVEELFAAVGIDRPAERYDLYPFEMSGGMLQRVVIAMAMSGSPSLLIADEATTALDVTTQATVLDLLRSLVGERQMAMVFITHDLAVASEFCDDIQVMFAGRIVERGTAEEIFTNPLHPYTQGLVGSLCTLDMPLDRPITTMPADIRLLSETVAPIDHATLGARA
ncbi:ABC transporter ATP-binding protein [Leifsonia shinshuensis]|uniref:ABC transporter ATP-binding protein n=1 Tax=Leifsonia shinshuensis TaxID=150026 RepID=UPI001F514E86|nr:ABC transporter ATP-binding protein [Leifsonia shinshuensis]MCI0158040.1 ABC transporter ATP-binding protein [Leifsonia shinshuensis]